MVHRGFAMRVGEEFHDQDKQRERMDRDGIDMKVMSLANPWVDCFGIAKGTSLSAEVNQSIAAIVDRERGRFQGLAALPLKDPSSSKDLLRTAVEELGLRGAIIATHVNGSRIDERRYWPVFGEASRLGVPIFIHPTEPPDASTYRGHLLSPSVGFPFETSIAALRLIYCGFLLKYPQLRLFIPHLGGALPYLIGRIDRAYELSATKSIPHPPSFYVKRNFYTDTIVFDAQALRSGLSLFGITHVMLGTDYPFSLGSGIRRSIELLESLHLPKEEIDQIEFGNAQRLLNLS